MDLSTLSPYIRIALDYTVPPNWHLKERVLFDYELFYVKEGEIEIKIEEERYHGIPGDIFIIKPKQKHSIEMRGKVLLRHPHLHFDLHYSPNSPDVKVSFKPMEEITDQEKNWFREDTSSVPPYSVSNHIRLKNPLIIEKMIFDIINEFNQKLPYYEYNCKGIFVQLWIHLLREQYWNENNHVLTNWESLNEVKHYLSRHLDEEISIDRLAKMARMSKYYFIRMFKNAFGITPSKYHQLIRIEKSKELVQFTSLPLTEIADNFGFQSIHSFSRTFKKVDGVKPSFYRRKGGNI